MSMTIQDRRSSPAVTYVVEEGHPLYGILETVLDMMKEVTSE